MAWALETGGYAGQQHNTAMSDASFAELGIGQAPGPQISRNCPLVLPGHPRWVLTDSGRAQKEPPWSASRA